MAGESCSDGLKISSPKVTIIIPAYKEGEYIQPALRGVAEAFRLAGVQFEIIVVLDLVPSDDTNSHVKKVCRTYDEIRIVERIGRRGVGDAIVTGIEHARGEIVIPVMGDQSEDPADIVKLASEAENYDVVFTNRFKRGRPAGYPVLKFVANRCCNVAAMLLFGIAFSDTTNAFKAYKRVLLDRIPLTSKGFEIFLEMPIKAMTLASRVDEIEVSHTVRRKKAAKLSVTKDGYNYIRVLLSLLRHEHKMKGAFRVKDGKTPGSYPKWPN